MPERDIHPLYVDWHLFPNEENAELSHAIYTPARFCVMVRNIFSLKRKALTIRLRGAVHPFYFDVAAALLAGSSTLILTYCENLKNEFLQRLFTRARPEQIKIIMPFMRDNESFKAQLPFIALAAENKQISVVRPITRGLPFVGILEGQRASLHIELMDAPVSGPAELEEARFFADCERLCGAPFRGGQICYPGAAYMRIDADGHFYNAPCVQALDFGPLWDANEADLRAFSGEMRCRQSDCPLPNIIPQFYGDRGIIDKLHSDLKLPPYITERIRRLPYLTNKSSITVCEPQTNIFYSFQAEIEKIYNNLADAPSREAFLRTMKAAESGDGGWLVLSAYDVARHPKIEIHLSRLMIDGTTDEGKIFESSVPLCDMASLSSRLKLDKPAIRLPISFQQIFEAPLMLMEAGYEVFWGYHGEYAGMLYGRHKEQHQTPLRRQIIKERISVIVPVHNNADTLRRALDSILIQGVDNLEIIAIDDASSDSSADIMREYVEYFPGRIRRRHLAVNKGLGYVRNLGMSMATGEFVTFLDSDDALAPNFLKNGLSLMKASVADIVSFTMLQVETGRTSKIGKSEAGEYDGMDSLKHYLLKRAGHYGSVNKIFRVEFLNKHNILFGETVVSEDAFFNIPAFFLSRKTVVVNELGYIRFNRPKVSHSATYHGVQDIQAFGEAVKFINHYSELIGLDKAGAAYRYCVKRNYTWSREKMYRAIAAGGDVENMEKAVMDIGSSRDALQLILTDYAAAISSSESVPPVLEEDIDWRRASQTPWPCPEIIPYGKADRPNIPAPMLSVIVPCYNAGSYLKGCIDSIFAQSMPDYELIVIDDASTDGSFQMLEDYASMDNRLRLYRLNVNCRQGIGRNIGVRKARGRYIIFVDADDLCLPDFFRIAVDAIEAEKADMAVFGSQLETKEGEIFERPVFEDGILNRTRALAAFWSRELQPEPWAKIFRADMLRAYEVEFPPYIYHQDIPFVFHAIKASHRVAVRSQYVYRRVFSANSTIRPARVN